MVETASVVATLVVVASVGGGVPLAAFASGDDAQVATNGTNASMAPGERLAGTVGVERAAVESEVTTRAFGQRVATAASNDSRAEVVGAEIEDLQARLDELAAERDELERARENGTISQGEYRARLARLHAEQRALQRMANRTEQVAGQLPADTLRANGVNVSALRTLRTNAANLTGPEVAEIARSVAGPNASRGFGPEGAGPPPFAGNRTGGPQGGPGSGGPPDEAGDGTGDRGPPEDAGNDSDGGPPANAGDGGDDNPAGDGNETGTPGDNGDRTGPQDSSNRTDPGGDGDESSSGDDSGSRNGSGNGTA